MVSAELVSAVRGHRPPRGSSMDLVALLALNDWDTATHLLQENPSLIDSTRDGHRGARVAGATARINVSGNLLAASEIFDEVMA